MGKWLESTNRSQVFLWLKTLCSVLLLVLLLRIVHWREVLEALRDVYPGWFLLAALANISQLVLSAWRWKMLLFVAMGERLSFIALLRYYVIGGLFNNFVPANLGSDALRAGVMVNQLQNKAVAVGSVVVERILNLAGLLGLAAWAIWFQILPVSLDIPAFWLISGILVGLPALVVLVWIGYQPPRFVQSSMHHLANFWRSCRKQPDAVALIVLLTLLQHVAMMLITFCTFRAVGVALPVALHLAIYAIAGLALTVPLTIQGIGVREGVYIGLTALVGVSSEATLAALALNYVILVGFSGLGALLLWFSPPAVKPQPG